jgi:HPt (histidine-containing phosphotransfer) domain-containing protein
MDNYLTKPIEPAKLLRMIDLQLSLAPPAEGGASARADEQGGQPPPHDPADLPDQSQPISMEALLDRCLGNRGFAESMLVVFEKRVRELMGDLEESVPAADSERIAFLAHALCGTSRGASAGPLGRVAAELEHIARSGDLLGADECMRLLRDEFRRCLDHLPKITTGATQKA